MTTQTETAQRPVLVVDFGAQYAQLIARRLHWVVEVGARQKEWDARIVEQIPDDHVLARFSYAHPLFTVGTLDAQRDLAALSGERGTFYAGAHLGNGFHEAGLASGVAAAAALGVSW